MTPPQREPRTPSRTPMGPDGGAGPSDVSMSDLLASCAAASAVSTPPAQGAEADARGSGPDAGQERESEQETRPGRRTRHRAPRRAAAR